MTQSAARVGSICARLAKCRFCRSTKRVYFAKAEKPKVDLHRLGLELARTRARQSALCQLSSLSRTLCAPLNKKIASRCLLRSVVSVEKEARDERRERLAPHMALANTVRYGDYDPTDDYRCGCHVRERW